ncbi:MAG: hypothetical protein K0R17_2537 [Rariglobus sp.]|nr:hypothetical protein [Rariglobus sp.]
MNASPDSPLELWGGVECSVVRIGDRIVDQLARTGHTCRLDDLDRFAELGIRTLRFPVLWEHHETGDRDWRQIDERLGRLQTLGIRPIIGFVHHGGGPQPGGLLDTHFVKGLAAFARAFARRYSWIDAYTPVNEPLTTARFSGLYGIWHPHGNSLEAFARIFMNECGATRAAMRAVRETTPRAGLVQTEDLAKTHSTPRLAYQASWENERRWLTFDLLSGTLTPDRPMWSYLHSGGVSLEELQSFIDDPCPPDVLGVNYYVTSERFLDERLHRYPPACRGGNLHERYADVPAVRVRTEGLVGLTGLLCELAQRHPRPIAITEIQLACTRDEQLRWLNESWHAALAARAEGVDVKALTAWSLLGAYDWDSLLLGNADNYEPGVFDVRSPVPRPTALAGAVRALSSKGRCEHPALSAPGWWRRSSRLEYPAVSAPQTGGGTALDGENPSQLRSPLILIAGAQGRLGRAFARICEQRGLLSVVLGRTELDVTDPVSVERILARFAPWIVVNATGYGRIHRADRDEERCFRENTLGAENLARACAARGARFVTFSTDFVFDGSKGEAYVESDAPAPFNTYGRSKLEAERRVLREHPGALIVRTSALFGPWDETNFVTITLRQLAGRRSVVAEDQVVSPTYVPDLVNTTLDLLIDEETGLWHVTNTGHVTWVDWAREIAALGGFPDHHVNAGRSSLPATRPRFSALSSERAVLLPSWQRALARYFNERSGPVPLTLATA